MRFLIDKDTELSTNKIVEIISQFETSNKIKLQKYQDYFLGKQEILRKTVTDASKPCNRIVTNYCAPTVENYTGYLTGQDIAYTSTEDIGAIQDVLNYNDVASVDYEYLRNALIYGKAFEIVYIDEDNEVRFKTLDSRECIPVYDNTLNQELLAVIRYYLVDTVNPTKGYRVEVYDAEKVRIYSSDCSYAALSLVEEIPHYFRQVPITVFSLNTDELSIFDRIMSLQDAYNNLLSSEVDDFQAFCDAYLVLKGIDAEEEDIAAMKQNRVLIMNTDADAKYLSKNISDTQIENMLQNLNDNIHKIANSPDFTQESFGTSSGIALRYRLLGFENVAGCIVDNMTKALQKRLELICAILSLTESVPADLWRDIKIVFTRNLPVDLDSISNMVNSLRGIVSDKTLIAQLPFVTDVDNELELLAAQQAQSASLYSFEGAE